MNESRFVTPPLCAGDGASEGDAERAGGGRGRGDALGESDAPREVPAVSVAPVSTVRSAGRGDADVPGISMAAVLA